MDDSSILDELFNKSAIVAHDYEVSGKQFVILKEPQASDSEVKVSGIPEDAVVVEIDNNFPEPTKIFDGSKSECKRADFAIISPSLSIILFIEMKRSNNSLAGDVASQLAGAAAVIDYSKSIVLRFWKETSFLHKYKERFVCFTNTGLDKRQTKVENNLTAAHDTPENFIKIRYPQRIAFNKLIGKLPATP